MSDSLFISSRTPTVLLSHNHFFLVHHPAGIQLLFFYDRVENVYVCYGFLKSMLSLKEVEQLRDDLRTGRSMGLKESLHLDMEIITQDTEKLLAYADMKAWTRARRDRQHAFPTRLFVEEQVTDETKKVYARYGFSPVSYTCLSRNCYGFVRTFATTVEATGSASALGIYGKNCSISWKNGKDWTNITNLKFLGAPAISKKYYARRFWGFDSEQSKQQEEPRATKANPLWGMRRTVSDPLRTVRRVARTHGARSQKAVSPASSKRSMGRRKNDRED